MIDIPRLKARKAIESLYEHTCRVVEYNKIKDPDTKITSMKEEIILKDVPCKLSFSTSNKTNQTESANEVKQLVKLFISPEIEIKEGSKVEVSHHNRTSVYKNSGTPSMFFTHQEINLELFKGWS